MTMEKKRALNRRRFLQASVLGTTGAILAKSALASSGYGGEENAPAKKASIITRKLGKTGLELPIVSMGVMRADNPNLVKAALEKGILHLDTAHVYQGGRNEEMLGELLKDYPRDSFTIATKEKLSGLDRQTGAPSEKTSMEEFMANFEISLERLKMDYVDILYVHSIKSREVVLHKPLLNTLQKIKKSGKAKYIGVSTHTNMAEVMLACTEHEVYDLVLTTYNFQMSKDMKMKEAIQKVADAGLGIVGMKTMAGGFLDRERQHPVNAKAALKWALQNENIHTTIPGYTSFDQLDESFSVMEDLTLSDSEKADLSLSDMSATLFCEGCNQCLTDCRKGLLIPDLMRAYMYTYGYHEYEKAQELLSRMDELVDHPCADCSECSVTCKKGFDIATRVTDVSRLKSVPREFFT